MPGPLHISVSAPWLVSCIPTAPTTIYRLPTVPSVSPVWPSLFCLRPAALTSHGTSMSWMPCRHLQFSTPQRELVTWQSPKTIRITLIRPSIGVGLSHGSLSSSTQLCQLWAVHASPANLLHTSLCLRESIDLSSERSLHSCSQCRLALPQGYGFLSSFGCSYS